MQDRLCAVVGHGRLPTVCRGPSLGVANPLASTEFWLVVFEKRQSPFLQIEKHVGIYIGLPQTVPLDAVFPKCGVALLNWVSLTSGISKPQSQSGVPQRMQPFMRGA